MKRRNEQLQVLLAIMERVKVANNTPYQVYGMSFVNVLKWKILYETDK